MKDFLLNGSRSNIIFANKEGLLSLLGISYHSCRMCAPSYPSPIGYVSIHILGLSLGTVILPPSPSFFRKQQQQLLDGPSSYQPSKLDPSAPRQNAKIIIELLSYSVVWWMLLAFVRLGFEVSRRMVRRAYFALHTQFYVKVSYAEMIARQTSHMSFGLQLTTPPSSLATFYSTWCSFPHERQRFGIQLILQANVSSLRKRGRKAVHLRCWRLLTRMHSFCSCWFVLLTSLAFGVLTSILSQMWPPV
jgi:hypothetical protein